MPTSHSLSSAPFSGVSVETGDLHEVEGHHCTQAVISGRQIQGLPQASPDGGVHRRCGVQAPGHGSKRSAALLCPPTHPPLRDPTQNFQMGAKGDPAGRTAARCQGGSLAAAGLLCCPLDWACGQLPPSPVPRCTCGEMWPTEPPRPPGVLIHLSPPASRRQAHACLGVNRRQME